MGKEDHSAWRRPRVDSGEKIFLIEPSSPVQSEQALQAAVARLAHHYEVVCEGRAEPTGLFAKGEEAAKAQLARALCDPGTKAIVATRGGYGAMRLLAGLEPELVRQANKLFVGFSDATALHHAWMRARVGSAHAPMADAWATMTDADEEQWVAALAGGVSSPVSRLQTIAPGVGVGRMIGGNLSLVTALMATPWALDMSHAVLFLEDVNERPYRVHRMLTTLRLSGCWSRVRAVVLGSFTKCEPDRDGVTVEQVLSEHFSVLDVPVVAGFPAGHQDEHRAIRFGDWAVVDATSGVVGFVAGDEPPPC